MKLWATNEVRAKSKFWYFLRKLKKVKKSNGQEISRPQQTLLKTKQLHALIMKAQLINDPFYATRTVRLYALSGGLNYARKVFDFSPHRSIFLWNSIVRAYAQAHVFDEAFWMFHWMLHSKTAPDSFSYACVVRACSDSSDFVKLRLFHGGIVVSGLGGDSICSSALVAAYSKLGFIEEASSVFSTVLEPDLVMWNSMISGYGSCGLWSRCLQMFTEMRGRGKCPDGYTLVALVSSLADPTLTILGEGVHGFCLKNRFDMNPHVSSSLVNMYARFKRVDSAAKVFESLPDHDLVTWSALITGYCQCGEHEKALSLFSKMSWEGMKPDPILIASVVGAAAHSANARIGSEIHGSVLRSGLESNIMVSSALIDMYSKCGFLGLAMQVFENIPNRNIVSYNSIILGLGLHGFPYEAFKVFYEMGSEGLEPDQCTFANLLSSCCHGGLLSEGKEVFRRMKDEFGIKPEVEHFVHMVKLLGMGGVLEEAYEFICSQQQPVESDVWSALLSCCEARGNTYVAELVAEQLLGTDSEKSVYGVMLSNVYASEGRWNDANKLRDEMVDRGLRKTPGLSWIGEGRY